MANESETALRAFHAELKELLLKYGIGLDIKAEIVAAYIGKPTKSPVSLEP